MNAGIKVTGLEQAIRKVNALVNAVSAQRVENVLMKGARIIADEAERRAGSQFKVNTGRLKGSPKAKKSRRGSNTIASVFAAIDRSRSRGAPHAQLLERGTSRMPARPFFAPAVDATSEEVSSVASEGIKKLVGDGAR